MLCYVPSMVVGWRSSKRLLKLMATKMWLVCMVNYNNIHNMRYQIVSYQLVCFATLGDWVYRLFMHHACLIENKEQYDKAGKILTVVLDNALEKSHIIRQQYDAFAAFQLKLAEKEQDLAYYVWKNIPMTFDAMMTSLVESVNSHIKNKSKANSKNNTSRSLQLSTQDTDGHISNVQKKHERELQLNVIGSKLNDAHLFNHKCVFMLHDQFDGRNFHNCAMLGCDSWILWNFELVSVMYKMSNNTICNVSFCILQVVTYQL